MATVKKRQRKNTTRIAKKRQRKNATRTAKKRQRKNTKKRQRKNTKKRQRKNTRQIGGYYEPGVNGASSKETQPTLITANAFDELGTTPLMKAERIGTAAEVKALIAADADVTVKNKYGKTALHHAADTGKTEMVPLLLDADADVNDKDDYGDTALQVAARNGHTDMVKELIKRGANIDAKDKQGNTALHNSVGRKDENMVNLLIDEGANKEERDKLGYTALMIAVQREDENMVNLLINKGANIDAKDRKFKRTPLIDAAIKGHTEMVKLLIERGADKNANDKYGKTALHHANVNYYDGVDYSVIITELNAEEKFMKDMNQEQKDLLTAVMSPMDSPELINKFIANIKLEKKNIGRDTDDIVKKIVNSKLNTKGQTALMIAAHEGHTRVVGILLAVGANVNDNDNYGNTALHHAAKRENNQEVVQQLLNAGAVKNARNKDEKTAYEVADDSNKGILSTQSGSLG